MLRSSWHRVCSTYNAAQRRISPCCLRSGIASTWVYRRANVAPFVYRCYPEHTRELGSLVLMNGRVDIVLPKEFKSLIPWKIALINRWALAGLGAGLLMIV
jgi:hypothetical protein